MPAVSVLPLPADVSEVATKSSAGSGARVSAWCRWMPLGLSAFAFVGYGLLVVLMARQRIGNWDTAIFVQVARGYSELSLPIVNVENPGMNQWGEHFSPMLVLLGPVYRIFPSTLTVQLCQIFAISLSVFLLTRTAMKHVSTRAALILGVAFAFSFGFQSGVIVGFHEVCFAAPLLVIVGDRYLDGRYQAAALWSLSLLLVKEDFGLVVGALGICLFIRGAHALGGWLCAGASGYLLVIVGWVIPAFNPRGQYDFLKLASGTASPWHAVLALPVHLFVPAVKPVTVLVSLAVAGFLGLRSPFLILLIPIFAERFAAPTFYYWGLTYHYSVPVMPIVFIAALEGLRRLERAPAGARGLRALLSQTLVVAVCAFSVTAFGLQHLVATDYWQKSDRAVAADELMSRIPAGASVQTDEALSSFLAVDHTAYFLSSPTSNIPRVSEIGADYVVVDQEFWKPLELNGVRYAREMNPTATYTVIFASEGLSLLERTDPGRS